MGSKDDKDGEVKEGERELAMDVALGFHRAQAGRSSYHLQNHQSICISLLVGLVKARNPTSLCAVRSDLSLQSQMCTAYYKMPYIIKYIIKCLFN